MDSLRKYLPTALEALFTVRAIPLSEEEKTLNDLASLPLPVLYPDHARCVQAFVAGSIDDPADVKFITERDPFFYNGRILLADGTSDGKKIEIVPGEIYMPFFAVNADGEKVHFFLPGCLIFKAMQPENNHRLAFVIDGKQVELYLEKKGDPRCSDGKVKGLLSIEGNGQKVNVQKIALQHMLSSAVKRLSEATQQGVDYARSSTPRPIELLNSPENRVYAIGNWAIKQHAEKVKNDETKQLSDLITTYSDVIAEHQFALTFGSLTEDTSVKQPLGIYLKDLNEENCGLGRFKISQSKKGDIYMSLDFTGRFSQPFKFDVNAENEEVVFIVDQHGLLPLQSGAIWLTDDSLIALKSVDNQGTVWITKQLKDNQLTVVNFGKIGVTKEQILEALNTTFSTEAGVIKFKIVAK